VIAAEVPRDKQEAVVKEVQSEIQKYLKDTVPQVRKSAQALAPSTIGAVLEAKLSEDELRQVVAILESPAYAKYQQLSNEMQNALQAKLVSATRATVEPRVQALEKALGERLKAAVPPAAASGTPPKAPAK
jgi:predicted metal-dependent hydrolase